MSLIGPKLSLAMELRFHSQDVTELSILPNPNCAACRGLGKMFDGAAMPVLCDCVTEFVPDTFTGMISILEEVTNGR